MIGGHTVSTFYYEDEIPRNVTHTIMLSANKCSLNMNRALVLICCPYPDRNRRFYALSALCAIMQNQMQIARFGICIVRLS